ncbi:MAG: hypothetical protein Q8M01_07990 [Rubrivivax sp.]|nr:hypothetical protein [Rubrivivax sp.]
MNKLIALLAALAFGVLTTVAQAAPNEVHRGKVLEAKTASGYTYLKVREGKQENWLASVPLQVAVGEEVEYTGGDVMTQFRSNAMNRTFEAIRFVSRIHVVGREAPAAAAQNMPAPAMQGMPADDMHKGLVAPQAKAPQAKAPQGMPMDDMHKGLMAPPKAAAAPAQPLVKPKDGKTVAELYAQRDGLNGKSVTLRGTVAKFSKNILGKNWITLTDGSGKAPDDKVVVVTSGSTAVGETVTVVGMVKSNVNLGSGYTYKVMLDEATLQK